MFSDCKKTISAIPILRAFLRIFPTFRCQKIKLNKELCCACFSTCSPFTRTHLAARELEFLFLVIRHVVSQNYPKNYISNGIELAQMEPTFFISQICTGCVVIGGIITVMCLVKRAHSWSLKNVY